MTSSRRDRSQRPRTFGLPGIAVDAQGGTVTDPTANVRALNEASIKRIDDVQYVYRLLAMSELSKVQAIADLRAEYDREIRELESDRLDKIRQVDVLAGNTAADRALIAIQTLAATTTANAETLRSMVANTATTIAQQTANTVTQQNERIASLEKSSYTGMGKQAYADPQQAEMLAEMKAMHLAMAQGTGKGQGMNASWIILLGAVSLLGTILSIGAVLFAVLSRR